MGAFGQGSLLVLLFSAGVAFAQDSCERVYTLAATNVGVENRDRVNSRAIFDEYCQSTGSVRSTSLSASVETVLNKLPLTLTGSSTDYRQKLEQFCKTFQSSDYVRDVSNIYEKTAAVNALELYNQCVALKLKGVEVTYTEPGPESFTVTVDFDPTKTNVTLRSVVYDEKLAKCTLSGGGLASRIAVNNRTQPLRTKEGFTIDCPRTPFSKGADGTLYPAIAFTMSTNHGAFTLRPQADTVFNYARASINKAQADAANATNTSLTGQVAALTNTLSEAQNRLNNATASGHVLVVGENRFFNFFEFIKADKNDGPRREEKIVAHINSSCSAEGATPASRQQVASLPGNCCGYAYIVYSCLKK